MLKKVSLYLLVFFYFSAQAEEQRFINIDILDNFSQNAIDKCLKNGNPSQAFVILNNIGSDEKRFICQENGLTSYGSNCLIDKNFDFLLIKIYSELKNKGSDLVREFYEAENIKTNRVLQAFYHYKKKLYAEAISIYDDLLIDYPENIRINQQLVLVALEAKNYDVAIATLDRLIILDEFNFNYYFKLIDLYIENKMLVQAKSTLKETEELFSVVDFETQTKKYKYTQKNVRTKLDTYYVKLNKLKQRFFFNLGIINKFGYEDNIKSSTSVENMREFLLLQGYSGDSLNQIDSQQEGSFYYSPSAIMSLRYENFIAKMFGNYNYFFSDKDMTYYLSKTSIGYFNNKIFIPLSFNVSHLYLNYSSESLLNIYGFDFTFTKKFFENSIISFATDYQRIYYVQASNRQRNNDKVSFKPAYMYLINKNNFISVTFKVDLSEVTKESRDVPFTKYLSGSFKLSYGYKKHYFGANVFYQNKGTFYETEVSPLLSDKRIDVLNSIGTGVSYILNSNNSVNANYTYTINKSNFPISRYTKNNISFGYMYKF
jgi:tetratricopeptide (TPR) repeat protein